MIAILCNSFDEVQEGFSKFMEYLEFYEPLSISRVFEYSYCVETDDDLRYIFVDYRLSPLLHNTLETVDEICLDEFLEGIDYYPYGGIGEMFYVSE